MLEHGALYLIRGKHLKLQTRSHQWVVLLILGLVLLHSDDRVHSWIWIVDNVGGGTYCSCFHDHIPCLLLPRVLYEDGAAIQCQE